MAILLLVPTIFRFFTILLFFIYGVAHNAFLNKHNAFLNKKINCFQNVLKSIFLLKQILKGLLTINKNEFFKLPHLLQNYNMILM